MVEKWSKVCRGTDKGYKLLQLAECRNNAQTLCILRTMQGQFQRTQKSTLDMHIKAMHQKTKDCCC